MPYFIYNFSFSTSGHGHLLPKWTFIILEFMVVLAYRNIVY